MAINNILLSINIQDNNNLQNKSIRGRFNKKGQFYSMMQFGLFKPKQLYPDLKYNDVKKYIVSSEGLWLISPKYVLNSIMIKDKLKYYSIPTQYENLTRIDNIRIVKIRKLRKELWDSTSNVTNADLIYKMILPIAVTILAICCLIFFPRMYDTIMAQSSNALAEASNNWIDTITNLKKPIG